MLNIDRLDARLLSALSRDSRVGIGELASALGVARNTVQARLRRLTEAKVLRGYRPDIDLAAVGIAVQAFVALEIHQSELRAIARTLGEIPEVLEVHATTGREDLLVRVATSTQADLQQLVEQIVSLNGVMHSSTTLALTTPLPYRIEPLLEALTERAGWGRATPAPEV
ncbi:MAG: AsnC family transcriptional regulator [Mycobacterium sp.]|nr:AsnC family transcriptional regulator [Mycobacterium sp.]